MSRYPQCPEKPAHVVPRRALYCPDCGAKVRHWKHTFRRILWPVIIGALAIGIVYFVSNYPEITREWLNNAWVFTQNEWDKLHKVMIEQGIIIGMPDETDYAPTAILIPATLTPTSSPKITSSSMSSWTWSSPTPTNNSLMPSETAPAETIYATTTPFPGIAYSAYRMNYQGCQEHGMNLGQLKGRVFDRNGEIISGAIISILVEGTSGVVPDAVTNEQGWYEFNLTSGQNATIIKLNIDSREVMINPVSLTLQVQGGCYQLVDFWQI